MQRRSDHSSLEKTVRVICDYYQKATTGDAHAEAAAEAGAEAEAEAEAEAALFWRNRQSVLLRLLARAAPGQF